MSATECAVSGTQLLIMPDPQILADNQSSAIIEICITKRSFDKLVVACVAHDQGFVSNEYDSGSYMPHTGGGSFFELWLVRQERPSEIIVAFSNRIAEPEWQLHHCALLRGHPFLELLAEGDSVQLVA